MIEAGIPLVRTKTRTDLFNNCKTGICLQCFRDVNSIFQSGYSRVMQPQFLEVSSALPFRVWAVCIFPTLSFILSFIRLAWKPSKFVHRTYLQPHLLGSRIHFKTR